MDLPKRYDPQEAESKWRERWEREGIYRFDPDAEGEPYAIDTPPPTVSGVMHLGHAFSYSQQDFIARFWRMRGRNVFYPFGTDDNGLATERLIEKMKGVKATRMDRGEFAALCLETLEKELRPQYIEDWKRIGMSCDFSVFYTTLDDHTRRISQRAFLDLVAKERVFRKKAPVIWDPVMQTALSQVELVDQEKKSTFNDIVFKAGEEEVLIGTTRPELLCSCVGVFFHPGDSRYAHLEGNDITVPVYGHTVTVRSDKRVDPEKGTGIVMCCTFGDQTDIEWYKAYNLELRVGIGKDGKMTALAGRYEGMKASEARAAILADMKDSGELRAQQEITHVVNVGERSGAEIEIIESEQWFIRVLDIKDELLARGKEMRWYPEHMRHRYENWIKGLQWDWCISRQRFSGIPFPVWYEKKSGKPLYASPEQLPVDPLVDLPEGYSREQVVAEPDVMDTWATSSLTPRIAAELTPIADKLLPMALRPQAHDIITFWLFNTVVRAHLHDEQIPFKDIMISGWALDPHGKKMSKSKGNVVAPQKMIEKYSADALRFWAAGSRLGEDLPFQEKDLVTGQKLLTKLWNASKFCLMHLADYDDTHGELEVMDRWLLSRLTHALDAATTAFERYEYSTCKMTMERWFWNDLCDHYLELVKDRLYNAAPDDVKRRAAQHTLKTALTTILKALAPITPYITEEIWRSAFSETSIHRTHWPTLEAIDEDAERIGEVFVEVVNHVRRAKSEKNVSLKTPVKQLLVRSKLTAEEFASVEEELRATTRAERLEHERLDEESDASLGVEIDL